MPRLPRQLTVDDNQTDYYHVYNRVAGPFDFFPFADPLAREEFLRLFMFHLRGSRMRLASYQLMSNHFHLVLKVPAFQVLCRSELEAHARHFYGSKWRRITASWTTADWHNFNKRLFNLSPFMQQFQAAYATWYNRQFSRRGSFWASRFKANLLSDRSSMQECILYVELNAVRAALVSRPEHWKASSARWRWLGRAQDLIPIDELFDGPDPHQAYADYRFRLLYRGSIAQRTGEVGFAESALRLERERGFTQEGSYRQTLRFFTEGLVVGKASLVSQFLEIARQRRYYRRRSRPIPQLNGLLFTLREQRSQASAN